MVSISLHFKFNHSTDKRNLRCQMPRSFCFPLFSVLKTKNKTKKTQGATEQRSKLVKDIPALLVSTLTAQSKE